MAGVPVCAGRSCSAVAACLLAARDAMAPAVIADFGCFALPRFLHGARWPR